jgi:hypothetical protein
MQMPGKDELDANEIAKAILKNCGFVTLHVDQAKDNLLPKGGAYLLGFDPATTSLYWASKECKNFMRVANYLSDKTEAESIQEALIEGIGLFKDQLSAPDRRIVEIADYAKNFDEALEGRKPWFSDVLTERTRYQLSIDQTKDTDWVVCEIRRPITPLERIGMMNEVASLAPWCDVLHANIIASIQRLAHKKEVGSSAQRELARGKRRIFNLNYGGFQGMLVVFVSPGKARHQQENPDPLNEEALEKLAKEFIKAGTEIARRRFTDRLGEAHKKLAGACGNQEILDALLIAASPCQCIEVHRLEAAKDPVQKSIHWDSKTERWDGYRTSNEQLAGPIECFPVVDNVRYVARVEPLQKFASLPGMSRSEIQARLQALVALPACQQATIVSKKNNASAARPVEITLSSTQMILDELVRYFKDNPDRSESLKQKDAKDIASNIAIVYLWREASKKGTGANVAIEFTTQRARSVLLNLGIEKANPHPCSKVQFEKRWQPLICGYSPNGGSRVTEIPCEDNGGGQKGVTVTLPRLS